MSVSVSDLKFYKSISGDSEGGAINTNAEITDNVDNNLIPDIGSATVKYKKIFLKNTNSNDSANNVVLYSAVPLNTDQCTVEIALGSSTDTQPPASWYSPQSYDTGINVGTLGAGDAQGIWIKITTVPRTKSTGSGGSVDFVLSVAFT